MRSRMIRVRFSRLLTVIAILGFRVDCGGKLVFLQRLIC